MTSGVVPPAIPPTISDRRLPGPGTGREALPLPQLAPPPVRSAVCATATIDCNGRVAETAVITALGWVPGTHLNIQVHGGLILITADPHAAFRMTRKGQVRLPAAVRHWCGLTPGSRVLLAADPAAGRLVVHPPAALDAMITQFHATVLDGDVR